MGSAGMEPEPRGRAGAHPDFAKLARYLEALASPARLELLHLLRMPRTVGDIRLRPTDGDALRPDRAITRQGVRKHLAKLEEAGVITVNRPRGATSEEYLLNHQMLFALVEELRRVTQLAPTVSPVPAATMTGGLHGTSARPTGTRIVVVHGSREGQTFPLEDRTLAQDKRWVLGRRRGLAVSLDHDPFVSQQHAEIVPAGQGYELRDLRTNKNGTELNWEALPRGGAAPLETGDVIGVGRTLLLFRAR